MLMLLIAAAFVSSCYVIYKYGLPVFILMCQAAWGSIRDCSVFIFEKIKSLIAAINKIVDDGGK